MAKKIQGCLLVILSAIADHVGSLADLTPVLHVNILPLVSDAFPTFIDTGCPHFFST